MLPAAPTPPFLALTGAIAMVPVVRHAQAFADEVRRAVAMLQPDCLLLELPGGLAAELPRLLDALPEIRVLAWKGPGIAPTFLAADPCDGVIEGLRLALENGIAWEAIDSDRADAGTEPPLLPDDFAIATVGLAAWAALCAEALPPRPPTARDRLLAARIRRLAAGRQRPMVIAGLERFVALRELLAEPGDGDQAEPTPVPLTTAILPIAERELTKVLLEVPFTAYLYEVFRTSHGPEERFPMLDALQHLLDRAGRLYRDEYDDTISLTEWRALHQFARNLSRLHGRLRPRLYELLTAARGCVDDDFGAIAMEVATGYPPNHREEEASDAQEPWKPTPWQPGQDAAEQEAEAGDAGEAPSRSGRHRSLHLYADFGDGHERLSHAYAFPELEEFEMRFRRRRPTEAEKERWRDAFASQVWMGSGICSWPPEDEMVEDFFRTVRHRALQQASENHTTVEEFSTSILDGIDVRETMRRWPEKKLFVRRERIPPGRVGPVVVLWKDFPLRTPDLWRTVLYAENQNESDIAFHSTPLGTEMVGPGITRIEYFGILSVFPARGIPNVWRLPPLMRWRTCGRLLIAAALTLSEERYVAVVAPHPPDAELRTYARDCGRGIIYLPLGTFGKGLLHRVRQCHILAGKAVRGYAADYIPRL